jgi:adenosylcobinamide-GDP ribazoletransferase
LPVDEAAAARPASDERDDGEHAAAEHAAAEPAAAAPAAARERPGLAGLSLAVAFLTILPVRVRSLDLGAAAAWFPAVGAAVGALAGAVWVAAEPVLGPTAASVLALVALVAVTGALHQDGLADTADGLGVRGDRQRRLAVMRDSATGAFGVLALIAWALLMVAALAPLTQLDALAALIAIGALSRWAALLHAAAAPPARTDGLGAGFQVRGAALAIASASAVAIAAGAALLGEAGAGGVAAGAGAAGGDGAAALGIAAAATAVALAIGVLSARAARGAVGGRTGDTIGATVAVVEVAVALVLLGFWR